jgi:hypothetical protein
MKKGAEKHKWINFSIKNFHRYPRDTEISAQTYNNYRIFGRWERWSPSNKSGKTKYFKHLTPTDNWYGKKVSAIYKTFA